MRCLNKVLRLYLLTFMGPTPFNIVREFPVYLFLSVLSG